MQTQFALKGVGYITKSYSQDFFMAIDLDFMEIHILT